MIALGLATDRARRSIIWSRLYPKSIPVFGSPETSVDSRGYSPSASKPKNVVSNWQAAGLPIDLRTFDAANSVMSPLRFPRCVNFVGPRWRSVCDVFLIGRKIEKFLAPPSHPDRRSVHHVERESQRTQVVTSRRVNRYLSVTVAAAPNDDSCLPMSSVISSLLHVLNARSQRRSRHHQMVNCTGKHERNAPSKVCQEQRQFNAARIPSSAVFQSGAVHYQQLRGFVG